MLINFILDKVISGEEHRVKILHPVMEAHPPHSVVKLGGRKGEVQQLGAGPVVEAVDSDSRFVPETALHVLDDCLSVFGINGSKGSLSFCLSENHHLVYRSNRIYHLTFVYHMIRNNDNFQNPTILDYTSAAILLGTYENKFDN